MYNTSSSFLASVPVPSETRTYKPVSHSQIIDLTLASIDSAGFKVQNQYYTATKDGVIANGKYTIANVNDDEMVLQIGWQNSYNKTKSLKFAIGAMVIICGNGMVYGDHGNFRKKHMGDIQEFTPAKIYDYIKASGDVFNLIQRDKVAMKNVQIDDSVKARLLGKLLIEDTFIKPTQANIIAREINMPTHSYNAPDSLWEFYNYTTFAMKGIHPSIWMDNHIAAHEWFVNEMGELTGNINTEMFTQLELFPNELG